MDSNNLTDQEYLDFFQRLPTKKEPGEKISDAIALMFNYKDKTFSYWASVAASLIIEEDRQGILKDKPCWGIAVYFCPLRKNYVIIYDSENPAQKTITVNETIFLLIHEMKHVMYGHVSRWMLGNLKGDLDTWNIATDRYINSETENDSSSASSLGYSFSMSNNPTKDNLYWLKEHQDLRSYDTARIYEEELKEKQQNKGNSGDDGSSDYMKDFHIDHSELKEYAESSVSIIKKINEVAKSYSNTSIPLVEEVILNLSKPKVNWANRFKAAIARNGRSFKDLSYSKINIACKDLPGTRRFEKKKICAVIDVSGSIDNHSFNSFFNELKGLSKYYKVDTIQVDTEVTGKPEPIKNWKTVERTGSGGTDMNPGIDLAAELQYDSIVLFTDGYIPKIQNKKPITVVVTENGSKSKNCYPDKSDVIFL